MIGIKIRNHLAIFWILFWVIKNEIPIARAKIPDLELVRIKTKKKNRNNIRLMIFFDFFVWVCVRSEMMKGMVITIMSAK